MTLLAYALAAVFGALETIAIHSTLVGRPAIGALVALAIVGGVGFAVTRMIPAAVRSPLLARAAILTSVLALASVALLRARMGAASGTVPAARPFVQTALLMVFQLGWALTYWLSVARKRVDQTRYVPAAIGAVLLIGGGLLTGGLRTSGQDRGPATAVFKRFATAEDYPFAQETERAGEESGSAFAHFHTGRQPLVGLSFSTRDWMRRVRIDGDLVGIFSGGTPTDGTHRVVADPGYVVASVEVQADRYINAIRVEFGRYEEGRILVDDRYWSNWYGSYARGGPTTRLGGASGLVIGVRGTGGLVLNSLSLLTADP